MAIYKRKFLGDYIVASLGNSIQLTGKLNIAGYSVMSVVCCCHVLLSDSLQVLCDTLLLLILDIVKLFADLCSYYQLPVSLANAISLSAGNSALCLNRTVALCRSCHA